MNSIEYILVSVPLALISSGNKPTPHPLSSPQLPTPPQTPPPIPIVTTSLAGDARPRSIVRTIRPLAWLALILALATFSPTQADPQSNATKPSAGQSLVSVVAAAGSTDTNRTKRDWYPFRGEVASIRPENRAIHLRKQGGARILRIDDSSDLQREGKKITIDDVKIGEFVRGKVHRNAAGEEVITAAIFEKEPSSSKAKARTTPPREKAGSDPSNP